MNWLLLISGLFGAITTIGHFTMGRKEYLIPMLEASFEEVPKKVMHCVFHYVSAYLILSTIVLLALGFGVTFSWDSSLLVCHYSLCGLRRDPDNYRLHVSDRKSHVQDVPVDLLCFDCGICVVGSLERHWDDSRSQKVIILGPRFEIPFRATCKKKREIASVKKGGDISVTSLGIEESSKGLPHCRDRLLRR